ncbi:hypothetical protein H0E87_010174 [Populus deltoides]|uniref:valine--tRNA ligase n=1 Tax=Populus deltoides TaxID=3696 RepID=A0A8T2YRZ1_POPDE|nr:hypothetical protein H0E87_010174 [Populus deltoides]
MEATPEQLERKKKKEDKAREKELKKLKAAQKEAKFKVQLQSKKKLRREEEEKVVEEEEDYRDPLTASGQKKRLSAIMPKNYNPSNVEKCWYEWWEASGFFVADANSSKPPFVILLPPPNVTGNLHLGHALTAAIQDTMIRWKRMSGFNALWVPGLDHAGIATQVVVEKKLMRERQSTRHDLGREKFVSEVWKWKHEHGGNILKQLRRLGASLDWSRECFTMDEKRSKAVIEEFVRLFKEGLIYRDLRLVHWDCTLRTAISDDEVDKIDIKERKFLNIPGYDRQVEFGVLTSFAYPIEGGLGEIVVSTTRVETMLGDTAIAVHPGDERYSHLHGKFANHPFNGRKLPIICDAILVDPSFGTGAVKITPAHDQDDFKAGKRHSLEFIVIFTDDGKINDNGGAEFSGMPRFEARKAVKEALKKKGLYRGAENNEMHLGLCSRSNDVVEPMLKPQWFVNCESLAKQALQAATDGENPKLEFIPKQFLAEWKRWLGNIQDWCISRQLWWGHRIPAWYVTLEDDAEKDFGVYNDHWVVGRNEEAALAEASQKFSGKKFDISQDPDVLDTWFSSGLFPLSVLGWPDDTDDLRTFYPTSVLETGHDILFFWVARMVMLGIQLGGDVPFRKVFLHPMVRDAHGRKMSKSLGNVIDPLEVIDGISLEGLHKRLEEGNLDQKELVVAKAGQKQDFPNGIAECGTDALRFALVSYTAQSDKINLDIQRVVGYRQWCNKLWNAVRFAMSKFDTDYTAPINFNLETMPFICKWILSFCDIFIEAIKPYFAGDDPAFAFERSSAQDALWVCLDNGLRLLHPFMPFVTEELWQRLPPVRGHTRKESIVTSEYPSAADAWTNEEVEYEMDLIESTVKCLRSLRAEVFEDRKNERLPAFAFCKMRAVADILTSHNFEILTLAKNLSSIQVLLSGEDAPPAGCAFENVNENLAVYLKAGEKVNAEVELVKMRNKMDEIQKQQERLEKKINAAGYKEKVPLEIQGKDTEKLSKLVQEMELFEKESERLEAEKSL